MIISLSQLQFFLHPKAKGHHFRKTNNAAIQNNDTYEAPEKIVQTALGISVLSLPNPSLFSLLPTSVRNSLYKGRNNIKIYHLLVYLSNTWTKKKLRCFWGKVNGNPYLYQVMAGLEVNLLNTCQLDTYCLLCIWLRAGNTTGTTEDFLMISWSLHS